MVRGIWMAALLVGSVASVAGAQEAETNFDGRWKLESMKLAGQEVSKTLGVVVLEIRGETYSVTINGEVQDKGRLVFDREKTPIHVDIVSDTPAAGQVAGIGKIENGKAIFALRINEGGERPANFEPNAQDTTLMIATYAKE